MLFQWFKNHPQQKCNQRKLTQSDWCKKMAVPTPNLKIKIIKNKIRKGHAKGKQFDMLNRDFCRI